jgi:hypothetical protein
MPNDPFISGPYLGSNRNPYNYEKIEQVSRDILTSWLTLDEITNQLNLFQDESQDSYLENLELATRMAIEDYLGMSIFPIQYKVYYGAASSTGTQMSLDLPEVSQDFRNNAGTVINSVGYYTADTIPVFTLLPRTSYFYDPTGNKIVISGGMPSEVNQVMSNPIVATYTTNANPLAQYPVIKQAGLLLLTHLYNNRSDTSTAIVRKIPFGVETLLRPYKPLVL